MTNKSKIRPRRSFIFTPGLRPDMYPKALASGADIVCVELEDGIAPKDKAEARKNALALFEQPQADDGVERIVRINSMRERFGIEDVNAIIASKTPPPALMMPKVRTPDEVVIVDPDAVDVLSPTNAPSITLVTCYPFYFVGSAPQRYVVKGIRTLAPVATVSDRAH